MTIRRLRPGDEGLLERFLSGHAETSMFLRSNLRASGLVYKDAAFHGDYLGWFSNRSVDGVLAHYWNGIIMMQAGNGTVLGALVPAFRMGVRRPVAGVMGPADQAEAVIAGLGLSDAVYAINRNEGLYALDLDELIAPTQAEPGGHSRMVAVRDVDRSVLAGWLKAYDIEALGSDDNAALDQRIESRISQMTGGADSWALLHHDRPVSLVGFNARLSDLVQIGPVWTPPELRGNGHARVLVALALLQARDQGIAKSILFTDSQAAIKAYEAIGFKLIGSYRLGILKEPVPVGSPET